MKSVKPLALVATAMLFAGPAHAQLTKFDAVPGNKVKISGTSTVHDWTVEGGIIGGTLELDAGIPSDPAVKATPGKFKAGGSVSIPLSSLKSGKPTMDEVMQEAMKFGSFRKITYMPKELELKTAPADPAAPLTFESKGELAISGVTNKVSFPVQIQRLEKGKLKVSGTTPIKMTTYGIKPPAPALAIGLIKVGEDVTVSFEWTVKEPAK